VRLVGQDKLAAFCQRHPDASAWIATWRQEVLLSTWRSPVDVKARYNSASFLSGNTVIFNVKGNHYRLEVKVAYQTSTVVITWVGTHAEYDKRNGGR
jgi:mRNA interferase HigB